MEWVKGQYCVSVSQSHYRTVQFPPKSVISKDTYGNDLCFMTPEVFNAFLIYNQLVICECLWDKVDYSNHKIVRGSATDGGTVYGQVWYTEGEWTDYIEKTKHAW